MERFGEMTPRWNLANANAIAGTGKRSRGHYFRRPRHMAAKRALMAAFGSLKGVSAPPSDWDDMRISADGHRSWKRHRATRWRESAQ